MQSLETQAAQIWRCRWVLRSRILAGSCQILLSQAACLFLLFSPGCGVLCLPPIQEMPCACLIRQVSLAHVQLSATAFSALASVPKCSFSTAHCVQCFGSTLWPFRNFCVAVWRTQCKCHDFSISTQCSNLDCALIGGLSETLDLS